MKYRLLGPVEVAAEDGPVALGGPKPRAVLAVLLLNANRPVSTERLAVALWGEDAPAGAAKTVQVHVSRLRKALPDADVVTTTPAGYQLTVQPGELDVDRFEQLLDHGRRALRAGHPDQASAALEEGLALWRGDHALADVAFEPFRGARDQPAGGRTARRPRDARRCRAGGRPPRRARRRAAAAG